MENQRGFLPPPPPLPSRTHYGDFPFIPRSSSSQTPSVAGSGQNHSSQENAYSVYSSPSESFRAPQWVPLGQGSNVGDFVAAAASNLGCLPPLETPFDFSDISPRDFQALRTDKGYCGESTSTAASRHIRISLSQSSSSSSPSSSSVNLRLHESTSPFSHYRARPCSDGHYIVCPVNGKRLVLAEGAQSIQDLRCNEGSSFSSMQSLPKLISASEREWIGSSELGWYGGMGMELDGHLSLEILSATLSPQEGLKARSPLTGRQNCSLCWRKLSQRSPWSSHRLLANSDLPSVGVLSCGHVYHADCLEQATPALQKHDPLCPQCDASKKVSSKKKGRSFLQPGKKIMGLMRPNSSRNGRKNSRIGVLMDDSKKSSSLEHLNEKVPVTTSENRGNWGASLLSAFGTTKAAHIRGRPFATQKSMKDILASNPVLKK